MLVECVGLGGCGGEGMGGLVGGVEGGREVWDGEGDSEYAMPKQSA